MTDVPEEKFNGQAIQNDRTYVMTWRGRRVLDHALILSTDMKLPHQDFTKWRESNPVAGMFRQRGYQVVREDFDRWEDLTAFLRKPDNPRFRRVVFVAHGGFDGPILSHNGSGHFGSGIGAGLGDGVEGFTGQAKVGTPLFDAFASALAGCTTDDARVYSSACTTGGGNYGDNTLGWTSALGEATRRRVAGPINLTAWRLTLAAVNCVLEETGPAPQDLAVFENDRVVAVRSGETMAQAKAIVLDAATDVRAARIGDVIAVRAWPITDQEPIYLAFVGNQYHTHNFFRPEIERAGQVTTLRLRVPDDAKGGRLRVKYKGDQVMLPFEVRRDTTRLSPGGR